MSTVIECHGIAKRYGRQAVLEGIDLKVPEASVFALLGENGVGKTTLVRILLGLERPDAGYTEILGERGPYRASRLASRVGYVPDRPVFHDWMTVAEVGWYTAGFFGHDFQSRFNQWITQYDLPGSTQTKALSKGMRTKLALALALAKDPEVLILDEPTSGLDIMVRNEVMESMVDLAAGGKTIFLCSHQIHEVERVADYVAVMQGSKILLVDRLEKLKTSYHDCRIQYGEVCLDPPNVGGRVVSQQRSGRQWRLLVEAADPQEIEQGPLSEDLRVESVTLETPNLEAIFVGLLGRHAMGRSDGGQERVSQPTEEDSPSESQTS